MEHDSDFTFSKLEMITNGPTDFKTPWVSSFFTDH